jgi:hypothetical protein
MGKVFVVLCCTLFVCGCVYHFVPGATVPIATWSHGVTWMMLIGCVSFIGSWKLTGK